MMTYTQITIDADRVRQNVKALRETLAPETHVMAILKADAYGLGALRMAGILDGIVDGVGVVTAAEAHGLQGHVSVSLLLFSEPLPTEDIDALIVGNVMFTVYTLSFLARLSQRALSLDKTVAIHLKANTGLNRLGFSPELLPELLSKITSSAHIQLMGIFTHLGFADEKDHPQTELQIAVFERLSEVVRNHGFHAVKTHLLSTHGVLNVSSDGHGMVRFGLGLYVDAVTISAPIGYIHDVQAGEWVSYSGLYHAAEDHKVAVVYAGYSAGIPSNTTGMAVMIEGQRYPVIGRICMDLIMVALPQNSDFAVGQSVVLYGGDGEHAITPEDWKSWAGLNPREIFCRFGYRATIGEKSPSIPLSVKGGRLSRS